MQKFQRPPRAQSKTKAQGKPTEPLPPDPKRRNANRARCAAAILAEFQRQTGADREDALSDLLADLMHWCDRSAQDFPEKLRRARNHYVAETDAGLETTARRSCQL